MKLSRKLCSPEIAIVLHYTASGQVGRSADIGYELWLWSIVGSHSSSTGNANMKIAIITVETGLFLRINNIY